MSRRLTPRIPQPSGMIGITLLQPSWNEPKGAALCSPPYCTDEEAEAPRGQGLAQGHNGSRCRVSLLATKSALIVK